MRIDPPSLSLSLFLELELRGCSPSASSSTHSFGFPLNLPWSLCSKIALSQFAAAYAC